MVDVLLDEEKDRIAEILFYYYFIDRLDKTKGALPFWNTVKSLCETYSINPDAVSRAVRIVALPENKPTEEETVYLLIDRLGMSSRPFNKLTGIYWQIQLKYKEQFKDLSKIPTIKRRINDIAMKKNIRDFIFAVYDFIGPFTYIDMDLLEKL